MGLPNSVNVNTEYEARQDLTARGDIWVWTVCAIMWFSAIVVFVWHLTIPRGHRVFHQIGLFILCTAGVAYFAMASNLGKVPIATEFSHANGFAVGTTRAIWYARYIDWFITTPALLLELLLASALPLSDILTVLYFDILMIVAGLVGALIPSSYKWGFFTFGMISEFYIWWVLAGPARSSAGMLGGTFKKGFTTSAMILSFLWLLYPISWGLSEGGNVITDDAEFIFYGILDVLAKPVFLFFHLFQLSKEDLTHLQLSSGKYTATSGIPADAEKNQMATRGTGNTAVPATTAPMAQKKGFFGRRGHYDANAPTVVAHDNEPRTSVATAVDHN